ncbi:DNA recombination protein RmuC [Halopseudomonas pachastrellae]|nr:DNA recombination protein RmuC [Halopseudomonas pachastrellae]
MVFMFIPIESAFVEALKADESLFQRAIEQNVLVATPTTLLTSLNIVRQLWRFEDQNRHTAELAERAGKIHDKLRTFLASMDGIGAVWKKPHRLIARRGINWLMARKSGQAG